MLNLDNHALAALAVLALTHLDDDSETVHLSFTEAELAQVANADVTFWRSEHDGALTMSIRYAVNN